MGFLAGGEEGMQKGNKTESAPPNVEPTRIRSASIK